MANLQVQAGLPLGPCTPQVFIAHAGEQKRGFVDVLRVLLRKVHGLDVFVDEWSLQPGNDAPLVMRQSLAAAAVGALHPVFRAVVLRPCEPAHQC